MTYQYSINSRGFIISRLQRALGVAEDGLFGTRTRQAVQALQQAARKGPVLPGSDTTSATGIPTPAPPGSAGPVEFAAAGIPWPCDFERALNLVSNFEGTSFGDCNATDIDGAGLTLGIAGFTSRHGEVQQILARYLAEKPQAVDALPAAQQRDLAALLTRRNATAAQWKRLFYGSSHAVISPWKSAFAAWGQCPAMQTIQLELARQLFWNPAIQTAESMGFTTLQAQCFFLDVAVQNGGWKKAHHTMACRMSDWQNEDPTRALTVAARAVAACAREQWRNDVLSRKMTLATGKGNVHGRLWNLNFHALIPLSG